MRGVRLGLISAWLLPLAACVSPNKISVPEGVPVKYEQGAAIVSSQKTHGVVVRVVSPEFTKALAALPSFLVVVSNGGNSEFDFSPANVSAKSGDKPVRIVSPEEMEKRVKREATAAAIATALNSASQTMAAAMPATTNVYGTGGFASATTYNPATTAMAQAQISSNSAAQMAAIAQTRDAQLQGLGPMLRRNTVGQGAVLGGVVKLDARDIKLGQPLEISVAVSGEVHRFVFAVGK